VDGSLQERSDVVGGRLGVESGEDRGLEAMHKFKGWPFGVICSEMIRGRGLRDWVIGFGVMWAVYQRQSCGICDTCDSINKFNMHMLHSPVCLLLFPGVERCLKVWSRDIFIIIYIKSPAFIEAAIFHLRQKGRHGITRTPRASYRQSIKAMLVCKEKGLHFGENRVRKSIMLESRDVGTIAERVVGVWWVLMFYMMIAGAVN
jgi:hypothetical protein